MDSDHRAVAGVDFINKSSSVVMVDGVVRAAVSVAILPVSSPKVAKNASHFLTYR